MKTTTIGSYLFALLISTSAWAQDTIQLCAAAIEDGNSLELQLLVENFDEVGAFQFAVAWDQNQYSLDSVGNFNPSLGTVHFGNETLNVPEDISLIRSLWFDQAGIGKSIEDGEALYSVYLSNANPGDQGYLGIVDDPPFLIEFGSGQGDEIAVELGDTDCLSWSFTDLVSSTEEVEKNNQVRILGNPIHGNLEVESQTSLLEQIKIYTLEGKLLYAYNNPGSGHKTFDLSTLPNGSYIVSFFATDTRLIESERIIIQR